MSKDLKNLLSLAGLALIWGSSFILMKRVLETPEGGALYSPVALGGMRLFLAGLTLSPLAYKALKKVKKQSLVPIAVVGTLYSW